MVKSLLSKKGHSQHTSLRWYKPDFATDGIGDSYNSGRSKAKTEFQICSLKVNFDMLRTGKHHHHILLVSEIVDEYAKHCLCINVSSGCCPDYLGTDAELGSKGKIK